MNPIHVDNATSSCLPWGYEKEPVLFVRQAPWMMEEHLWISRHQQLPGRNEWNDGTRLLSQRKLKAEKVGVHVKNHYVEGQMQTFTARSTRSREQSTYNSDSFFTAAIRATTSLSIIRHTPTTTLGNGLSKVRPIQSFWHTTPKETRY